jgi:hypothetical protein
MKIWYLIVVGALILGIISGSSALQAARAANPPITWGAISFIFFGSAFGVVFVLGIQLMRRNSKYAHWAIRLFLPISVYVAGAGASAAMLDRVRGSVSPPSLFFLIIGGGLLVGLGASWGLFRWKFRSAP